MDYGLLARPEILIPNTRKHSGLPQWDMGTTEGSGYAMTPYLRQSIFSHSKQSKSQLTLESMGYDSPDTVRGR
eukprot:4967723-Pleurochrysis_carterae.AAC.1